MDARPNFINGQWVGSAESIDVANPATGQPIAKVAAVSPEQEWLAVLLRVKAQ